MNAITPSLMVAQLREIGLDPKALPPLAKLDFQKRNKVMNTFIKTLGVQCSYCHLKDFRAATPNKKITTHMWNDFVRSLAMEGQSAEDDLLYCDSCHGGHVKFLDRRDLKSLAAWMQENYVDRLRRADGKEAKEHGCETCHGDPIEPKIFTRVWMIPRP